MGVLSYEEYLAQAKKALADSKSKGDESINKQAAEQKKVLQENYDIARNETERSYDDAYRVNAVQKLINEREIAENMANLGLTDSGLNRTQQTAAQLSYSNNRAKLDRQKQSQVDALARELASSVSTVEQNRLSALAENEEIHSKAAAEQATSAYNKQQELLEAARKEAEKKAEEEAKAASIIRTNGGLLSRSFTGTLASNGVDSYQNDDGTYTYLDNNSGKKTVLAAGVNPFTGTINKDVDNGTFSNGYQPDNINGEKLRKAQNTKKIVVYGNEQYVWTTGNNRYYYWNGAKNVYEELTKEELDLVTIKKDLMSDWRKKYSFVK